MTAEKGPNKGPLILLLEHMSYVKTAIIVKILVITSHIWRTMGMADKNRNLLKLQDVVALEIRTAEDLYEKKTFQKVSE